VVAIAIVAVIAWRAGNFAVPTGADNSTLAGSGGNVAVAGDKVSVEYVGTLDTGEEFDSGEVDFTVGAGEMIPGFDEAIAGMKPGEEKTFTVPPDKAYGEPDPSLVIDVPLTRLINKTVEITTDEFRSTFGEDPVPGKTYFQEGMVWNITVVSVDGNTTVVEHAPEDGAVVESPYGTEKVTVLNDSLSITLTPQVGAVVSTVYGDVRIASADADSMSLDFNHPLAGKTLTFKVTLVNVSKGGATDAMCAGLNVQKADKPVLDVFIMSYCPYGLQMQKAVLPVMALLGDKAEINFKWVNYAMHGQKEVEENTRQYCIEKDFHSQYLDYATCFTASGDAASCIAQAGIDSAALDSCIAEADAEFNITGLYNDQSTWLGSYPPYMVDNDENLLYGVRGSPTVVLNGQTLSVNRSPEDVKKAVCCSFNEMPEECSQTLSSTATSPGIGGGTGTANSASCS